MKKIVIIGGGFAGLSAARRFSKAAGIEVTLIDKKETSDFLPLLPDCLGRGISPDNLSYRIEDIAGRYAFKFIKEEVVSLDPEDKKVRGNVSCLDYDYLIIASGSETNFYGNDNIMQAAFKLDSAKDAAALAKEIEREGIRYYIVAGGGYSGIELATNIRRFLLRKKRDSAKVVLVEQAASILGALPQWMKDYVLGNLRRLDIDVRTESVIEKAEGGRVYISKAGVFEPALLVWAAGVKSAEFTRKISAQKSAQGRLKTDDYLRLSRYCFAAGDAADFIYQGSHLRMAVQFSIMQGARAAENILRDINGLKLGAFKPLDLGYVIPMAHNRSCGRVIGVNLKGRLPTLLHFLICIYRLRGMKNRIILFSELLKGR